MRRLFVKIWFGVFLVTALASWLEPRTLFAWIVVGPLLLLGIHDFFQKKRAVLRNFPILGHTRFLFESIRPEIHQYFIESDRDGTPFNRERRSLVYQRSKRQVDTVPFGTKLDVYSQGYEWLNHSLLPVHVDAKDLRIKVGGSECLQPYHASIFNISAMSFGALSKNAVRALNLGALAGGFAHNTGEGGLSPYHLQGGDLTWQIGTGYFSCRTPEGDFDPEKFRANARRPEVKMIEIKLSQGAKPGHGGILPAAKVTAEIAAIRGVAMGKDVLSPPSHTAFSTPDGLLRFVATLRELSGGKPIGMKLCVGKRREFISIVKAMVMTGIRPDFITVDGGEGGTGAAPLEFSNHVGSPLKEALIFVHNTLVGFGVRDDIRLIASGKVSSGFELISYLAIGADMCNAARAFMLSLGCIQALKCNTNACPVGVATQDPELTGGLVVIPKSQRVASFHNETLKSAAEMLGAMGIARHEALRPWHLMHRVNHQVVKHYGEMFEYLEDGDLLREPLPATWQRAVEAASATDFRSQTPAKSKASA